VKKGKSAWVADGNYMINDRWTLGATYQWDPKYKREDLASVRSRLMNGVNGVLNPVLPRPPPPTCWTGRWLILFRQPTWSLVGRYYSLQDSKPLEIIGGVQWDSCCLAVRVLARRYVRNREGEMNNAIQLEFVLKGLSSAGRTRTAPCAVLSSATTATTSISCRPSNTGATRDDYDPN
jgi:LPS-assembly protein